MCRTKRHVNEEILCRSCAESRESQKIKQKNLQNKTSAIQSPSMKQKVKIAKCVICKQLEIPPNANIC